MSQKSKDIAIAKKQQQTVVKSNELIQRGRFSMTVQQNKVILYLISQIKPNDDGTQIYSFSVNDFCRVCGIDNDGGKNIRDAKQALKALADMSVWVERPNNTETLLRWINKADWVKSTNQFQIAFNPLMVPYLYDLQVRYTSYALSNVLAMKSKYGIRLYELLKSYQHMREHKITFTLSELKKRIDADKYERFPDFRRYVLDIAMEDINECSDIKVEYEAFSSLGKQRGIDSIAFTIDEPEGVDAEMRNIRRERKLDSGTKEGFQALIKAIMPEN